MRLHLGCSDDLMAGGWINVDIGPPPPGHPLNSVDYSLVDTWETKKGQLYQQWDLNNRWPWPDNSADVIMAHEVFEHIHAWRPGGQGKIHCLNEAWRVLKPGGILDLTVPCFLLKNGNPNPGAVSDPTHCTLWLWDDIFYFGEQFNQSCIQGTYDDAIEAGERYRLGAGMGVVARFQYPPVKQKQDRTWEQDPSYRGPLVWRLREDAGGARTKLLGILEAVK